MEALSSFSPYSPAPAPTPWQGWLPARSKSVTMRVDSSLTADDLKTRRMWEKRNLDRPAGHSSPPTGLLAKVPTGKHVLPPTPFILMMLTFLIFQVSILYFKGDVLEIMTKFPRNDFDEE